MPLKSNDIKNTVSKLVTDSYVKASRKAYAKTGDLSSITKEVKYLQKKGYTNAQIASLLNTPSTDLTAADIKASVTNKKTKGKGYVDSGKIDYDSDSILGLPFRYSTIADPRRRIYNSTFLADSSVVSFIPGKPKYRKNDKEIRAVINGSCSGFFDNPSDNEEKFAKAFGINDSNPTEADAKIINWLLKNQKDDSVKGNRDLRYYRLEEDYDEFLEYIGIALATLGTKMGISNKYKTFTDYVGQTWEKGTSTRSIKFYATKNASVSESISNEFGASAIASSAKTVSDVAREAQFLTGIDLGKTVSDAGLSDDYTKTLTTGTTVSGGFASSLVKSATNVVSELINGAKSAATGINLYYPEIWKDSTFSRSYSLEFNFVSPYGTPDAIFQYVYLPFLVLFTLASPKQSGLNGYKAPFIVKVDMPGFFTSDCAVISSMSWNKGGSDNLFNKDGLPLAMNVSIQIKDLYPIIMQTNKFNLLRCNNGMHGFLDNMAGLSVERFTPFEDIKNSLDARLNYIAGGFNRKYQKTAGWLYRIKHPSLS